MEGRDGTRPKQNRQRRNPRPGQTGILDAGQIVWHPNNKYMNIISILPMLINIYDLNINMVDYKHEPDVEVVLVISTSRFKIHN